MGLMMRVIQDGWNFVLLCVLFFAIAISAFQVPWNCWKMGPISDNLDNINRVNTRENMATHIFFGQQ
jgi:hypothetical protein